MNIIWQALCSKKHNITHKTPRMVYMIMDEVFGRKTIILNKQDIKKLKAMAAAANDNLYEELAKSVQKNGHIHITHDDEKE